MKKPKVVHRASGPVFDVALGDQFSSCCGAHYGNPATAWGAQGRLPATQNGIVMHLGKVELALQPKEHLHHLQTRNGPLTFAVRKN